jgi:hypothetical protein
MCDEDSMKRFYKLDQAKSMFDVPMRMQQAGVIVSDYAILMMEILKNNARPEAAAVYGALDMPSATLVGQISKAYGKE